ncbi:hypothetical protein C3489_08695 [Streptomyces sp. Ru71]|nr:hypothetical protein C3489_08695 [Streptomyces sp. Ru71]
MIALLALVITLIVTSGGGGGKKDTGGSNGKNPAPSITPGPSGSGPAISQHPGGRDESSGGDSSGSGSGAGTGSDPGDTSGSGGAGAGSAGGLDDGINGSAGGGSGTGTTLPAGSPLPNCTPSTVSLTLRSVRNSYTPEQTPTFQIVARNTSAHDCKVDLGPRSAVVTITQADGADDLWSSADCPKGSGSLLYRVPGGSTITYVVTWDRRQSAPQCATPEAGTAAPGTYLVQAKAPGFEKAQTSFVLAAD